MSEENETSAPPPRKIEINYQKAVELVASSIEKSFVQSARDKVSKVDFELERFDKVFTEAYGESERSGAILVFAYIEDIMLGAFKKHLNGELKGGWDEITGGNGLLATANDRITMLAMLRWIKPSIYADLRSLKSIRNRFAHHADVNSCNDTKISSWIANLSIDPNEVIASVSSQMNIKIKPLTKQKDFLFRSTFIVAELLANLAIAPHADAANIHPSKIEGDTFDDVLDNIKELRLKASDMCMNLIEIEDSSEGPDHEANAGSAP